MTRRSNRGGSDSGLTPAMIEALKNRGYNQNQIAEMYGISRQRVSQIKQKWANYYKSPRERAKEIFPFDVPRDPFQKSAADKRLRDHAEYALTGGKGMNKEKLQRLRWFYNRLRRENVILVFDPAIPPSREVSTGGYAYVPRTRDDDDYIVRFNEDCDLSEEEKMLWRFPPVLPEV